MGDQERAWPLGAYAPGGYVCRCATCGQEFTGDKRAMSCLECAVRTANSRIRSLEGENARLTAALPLQPEGEVVGAEQALQAAKSLMIASGWWSNPAGYRTDAALWIEKAISSLDRTSQAYAKREGEEQGASRTDPSSAVYAPLPVRPDAQLSDGWRLVPVEPTKAMIDAAGGPVVNTERWDNPSYEPAEIWADMLGAAPVREALP